MFNSIFIIFLLFFVNAHAAWDEKKQEYYKNKYLKENNDVHEIEQVYLVSKKTKKQFTKKYGKDALKRLNYIDESIRDLKGASLYKKLSTIDKLVNKLHFMPDSKHWKKENYWATPLETIGTNYGDTEDMSLLKYVLMVKVGLDPRDIQLIEKSIPFKRKNKEYKENVSLFYFTKNDINPLVIDYNFRRGKIYKYEDQFKYKFIKKSPNKQWDKIFTKNVSSDDIDKIANSLGGKKIKRDKTGVHIYY
jgi:predicted transglutaminase-like cysteine proteinase